MADLQGCSSHSTNTYTRFFCKSFFFALCLVTIPLFPSQPPEFIDQTLTTQLWELLHLLFVGIAVSYGLFCRRNVDAAAATDQFVDPQSCGSRMFQISSIFDDGYDRYSCGPSDEKAASENWSWKCSERYPISEQGQVSGSYNGKADLAQAWNSRYVRGDSVAVVAQPNCNVDKFGWKPLGLPVRSLRSRVRNEVCSESNGFDELKCHKYGGTLEQKSEITRPIRCFTSNNQSIHVKPVSVDQIQFDSPKSRSLRSSGCDELKCDKYGNLVGESLEQKSDTTRPIRCFTSNNQSIHVNPVSVDQIQFESLKSRFLGSSVCDELKCDKNGNLVGESLEQKSDTTRLNSYFDTDNHSIHACPPSSHVRPVSVDQMQFESLKSRSIRSSGSSSQTSPVPNSSSSSPSPSRNMGEKGRSSGQMGGKGSLHSRHFSYGSSTESRRKRGHQDELKEFSCQDNDANLEGDAKPAGLKKSLSRARSVRTFRAKRSNNQVNHGRIEASEDFFSTISNYVPNATSLSENHWVDEKGEKHPEESGSECGQVSNLGLSSDEETVPQPVSDAAQDDFHEVDKKAGEFIAKFRQQIKLQKMMASIETHCRTS